MSDMNAKRALYIAVCEFVESGHADSEDFLDIFSFGFRAFFKKQKVKFHKADSAMLSALMLSEGKRIPADLRQASYKKIAEALAPSGISQIEQSAKDKAQND